MSLIHAHRLVRGLVERGVLVEDLRAAVDLVEREEVDRLLGAELAPGATERVLVVDLSRPKVFSCGDRGPRA